MNQPKKNYEQFYELTIFILFKQIQQDETYIKMNMTRHLINNELDA